MRKLIALVFNYSVNGLLAAEGTEYYRFCFALLDEHGGASRDDETLGLLRNAHAHIMGRSAYEGMSRALPANPDHPWASIINAGRKVVFSRTLKTAEWTNTTIATSDMATEIEALRQGGEGHIIVWGGVTLWHSLMRLDLMDEFRISMYPYIADEGRRVFDDVPEGYRLDLLSSVGTRSGVVELRYGRHR